VVRGEGLMKKVMEGRMRGKRGRGRPREGMISALKGDSCIWKDEENGGQRAVEKL